MNQADIVKRYLHNRADVDIPESGFPFVTISRQAGAGGHTLGRDILRELDKIEDPRIREGWDLFDQKLCAMIAQDKERPASFESLVQEEYRSDLRQSMLEMLLGHPEQYALQKKINEVIRLLARLGKVVIIGRGGMCLTQGFPQGLRIRLVAPENLRAEAMAGMLNLSIREALKIMRRQDRDRARMIREFFNRDIDDPLLYELTLNTETVSREEMASAVVHILLRRWPKSAAKRPSSLND